MASVSHPNLVAIHDIGTYDGRDYIVMDYVDGCTLRDWVAQESRPWTHRFDVLVSAGWAGTCCSSPFRSTPGPTRRSG